MDGVFKFPKFLNQSVTIWNLERSKHSVCKKSDLFKFNVREVIKSEKGQRLGKGRHFKHLMLLYLNTLDFISCFPSP